MVAVGDTDTGPDPRTRFAHDEVGADRVALILLADQLRLGPVERRLTKAHRGLGGIGRADRVGRRSVVQHVPIRPHRGRFEPHLAVHRVRAEEREVHPRVTRALGTIEHCFGPVLVVTERDQGFVLGQETRALVEVDARDVRDVQPPFLGPHDEREFIADEVTGSVGHFVVGPVEGHHLGALARPARRAVVQRTPAPAVVGLPTAHRVEDDVRGGTRVVSHGERNPPLLARSGNELQKVRTDGPRVVARDRRRLLPARFVGVGGRYPRRAGLHLPRNRRRRPHQARAEALVPTHSVCLDGEGGRDRGGEQVDALTALGAGHVEVALDVVGRAVVGDAPVPGAGLGVLVRDELAVRRTELGQRDRRGGGRRGAGFGGGRRACGRPGVVAAELERTQGRERNHCGTPERGEPATVSASASDRLALAARH